MKKLYIMLIALTLAVAMIVPAGVANADPGVKVGDVQAFLNQYNVAVNPAAKADVANLALQQPDTVTQMAAAYASMSPAGSVFVAGPTGFTGTPAFISVGDGYYVATMI